MPDDAKPQIAGYRNLTEDEIALINEVKGYEAAIAKLQRAVADNAIVRARRTGAPMDDGVRQAAIAKTEFEGAFMRLVRAVAEPDSPWKATL